MGQAPPAASGRLAELAKPTGPARLTREQWQQVLYLLSQGAMRAGFETERWTLWRIRAVLLVEVGVDSHPQYLTRRLRALGWSPQQPAVYGRERNDDLMQAWLTQAWPRIKKNARRQGAEIVFVDETGFSFRERTATTWGPSGQTPVLRRVSKRRELSTVIALTLSGKIYKRHFPHAVSGAEMVVALHHFQRHIPGPMLLIWDRATTHRATIVKDHLAQHPESRSNGCPLCPGCES